MGTQRSMSRRKFLGLSTLGIVGGILAACAPTAPAAPTAAPAATAASEPTAAPAATVASGGEPVELRWLDWSDQDDIVNNAIASFKERFPNVTINFEPIGDAWGDKQLTQMVSGTAPDILTSYDVTSYIWAEKGQLLDLNPLVERDLTPEQIGDFFDHQWNGLIYPGSKIRMGIPYYAWVYQYYYNMDAFDEAGVSYPKSGWTVDDYSTALEKLVKKDADGKIVRWGGIEACYEVFRIGLWLRMFGGNMVDPNDWTHCTLSSEECKAALEWHRKRVFDDNTLVQPAQLSVQGYFGLDPLVLQKVAILGQGSGDMFAILNNPPGFRWATAVPPVGPSGKPTGIGTIDNWGIWKGTKSPEMAWEFVKMLALEDAFQMGFAVLWGSIPNRKSLLPGWKDAIKKAHEGTTDEQLDPQLEALKAGFVQIGEQFKDHKGSSELITPVLEKILIVGDSPVTIVDSVCEEVTALNRE